LHIYVGFSSCFSRFKDHQKTGRPLSIGPITHKNLTSSIATFTPWVALSPVIIMVVIVMPASVMGFDDHFSTAVLITADVKDGEAQQEQEQKQVPKTL